jgi:hypothetical protein
MIKVRKYSDLEAEKIKAAPVKFYPVKDVDGNYYLSLNAAKVLSQIEGYGWAAANETNIINYKPTTDV